jgi:hypothetical protein
MSINTSDELMAVLTTSIEKILTKDMEYEQGKVVAKLTHEAINLMKTEMMYAELTNKTPKVSLINKKNQMIKIK